MRRSSARLTGRANLVLAYMNALAAGDTRDGGEGVVNEVGHGGSS